MRKILPLRRLALLAAAAVPFVLAPVGSAWSVGPLARVGARWCSLLVADFSSGALAGQPYAPSEDRAPVEQAPGSDEGTPPSSESQASSPARSRHRRDRPLEAATSRVTAARRAETARPARPNVFVGPDAIQRAIPVASRPTSAWTHRTPEHPAGLLIQTPGALTGVIESGDILVEAEGQPLGSFEQLLVTVRQAYERRVKRLSGRLFRKGDLLPVTVEPGW